MAYSLLRDVARVVCARGHATAREVCAEFPTYTEREIRVALRNASFRGHLSVVAMRAVPERPWTRENVYAAPNGKPRVKRRTKPIRGATSVWDYAQRAAGCAA